MNAKPKKILRQLQEMKGDKFDAALLGTGMDPAEILKIPKKERKLLIQNLNMALLMERACNPMIPVKDSTSALESADERLFGKVPINTINVNVETQVKAMSDDELYTRLRELARENPRLTERLRSRGIQFTDSGSPKAGGSLPAGVEAPRVHESGLGDRREGPGV